MNPAHSAGYPLKDPVGRGLIEREIAQFVNDQEGWADVGPELGRARSLKLGGLERVREIKGSGEGGPVARFGGGNAQGDGEMSLTDAGWTRSDDR